jgi:hypothetical protein
VQSKQASKPASASFVLTIMTFWVVVVVGDGRESQTILALKKPNSLKMASAMESSSSRTIEGRRVVGDDDDDSGECADSPSEIETVVVVVPRGFARERSVVLSTAAIVGRE